MRPATMTPSFDDYAERIRAFPAIPDQSDLLDRRFRLGREGRLEVFYAPLHGVAADAQIVIVGLTPGLSQMALAFREARTLLVEGWRPPEIFHEIRRRMAFAGTMRRNLIDMLDRIGVAEWLDLASTAALFDEASNLLHSTSALRYPVTRDRGNYRGSPSVRNSRLLTNLAAANLPPELESLPDAMIVPLGRAVEQALDHLGFARSPRVLHGFPHPSGGNGHRVSQFKSEYRQLRRAVQNW